MNENINDYAEELENEEVISEDDYADDYDEEEDIEDVDEDIEEEVEEEEEIEEEAEEEEELEEAVEEIEATSPNEIEFDEDYVIKFKLYDKNGNPVIEEFDYKQLKDIVQKRYIVPESEVVATATTIINSINNNDLLRSILYYQQQGYTDKQIIEGLYKLYNEQAKNEPMPEFSSIEEEIEYRVNKKLEDYVKPLENKIKQKEFEEYKKSIYAHNNALIDQALKEKGYDKLEKDYIASKLLDAILELYPELDARISPDADQRWATFKLTKKMADRIVNAAFANVKFQNDKQQTTTKTNVQKVVNMSKKSLPKITPSASGKGKNVKMKKEYGTMTDRARAFDQLISL